MGNALITKQDGNWTDSGTWRLIEPNSFLGYYNNNVNILTTNQYSAAFIPSGCTVDGIGIRIVYVYPQTGGTVILQLVRSGDSVVVGQGYINATSIPVTRPAVNYQKGWIFVNFTGDPVVCDGVTAYKVNAIRSAGTSAIEAYVSGGTNWSRILRTTVSSAPQSGDYLIVVGEGDGSGNVNPISVTMNENDSTKIYGNRSQSTVESIQVANRATLTWSTTQDTYLKWVNLFSILDSGTVNIGTSGTPISSGFSANLQMDCSTNVSAGIYINNGGSFYAYGFPTSTCGFTNLTSSHGGVCNTAGNTLTIITGISQTFNGLETDIVKVNSVDYTISGILNSGQLVTTTSLGTQSRVKFTLPCNSTGIAIADTQNWQVGDTVVVTSSTTSHTEVETGKINTINGSTGITLQSGLSYVHLGIYPAAEVANLTRNVKIFGTSSTLQGYVYAEPTTRGFVDNCEFYWLGSNTNYKRGFNLNSNSAYSWSYFSISNCSFHDFVVANSAGTFIEGFTNQSIINNCVYYNTYYGMLVSINTVPNGIINHNLITSGIAVGMYFYDSRYVITNNSICCLTASAYSFSNSIGLQSFTGNIAHSVANSSTYGIDIIGIANGGIISGCTVYRYYNGIRLYGLINNLDVKNCNLFGYTAYLIDFVTPTIGPINVVNNIRFSDCLFASDKSMGRAQSPVLIRARAKATFENTSFGNDNGIYYASMTPIAMLATSNGPLIGEIVFKDCFLSGTVSLMYSNRNLYWDIESDSFISSQNHNYVTGDNRIWKAAGDIVMDTGFYSTTSPSYRLTPLITSGWLKSPKYKAPISSGSSTSINVKVRQSSAADGYAYNGQYPRLWMEKNTSVGVNEDTLLQTASSAGSGAWETLSGVSPIGLANGFLSYYVACGYTGNITGWLNVDDWQVV